MSLSDIVNLPTKAQFEEQNHILRGIFNKLDTQGREIESASWDYVHDVVARGIASDIFGIGDCFLVNHDILGSAYWRIIAISDGDIYNPDYKGEIVVDTMKFTSKAGARNDFNVKYKRYSNDDTLITPEAGDVTEVRLITASENWFGYSSGSGKIAFGTAPVKNSVIYIDCVVAGSPARTTIFGDGTTTEFVLSFTNESETLHPSEITLITMPIDNWDYDILNGIVHIGEPEESLPFNDVIEIDVRTKKPSITLQIVNSLDTTKPNSSDGYKDIQFDGDNVNFYPISNLRQWLNTDGAKGMWFQKQSSSDNAPTWATTTEGFLQSLDASFLKYVGKCRKLTCLPNNMKASYNNASTMLTTERFFLLSLYEVNAGNNNNIAEGGFIYPYYDNLTSAELNATRVKKVGTTNKEWWLRSPYVGNTYCVYNIASSGGTFDYHADFKYGVAPACIIV